MVKEIQTTIYKISCDGCGKIHNSEYIYFSDTEALEEFECEQNGWLDGDERGWEIVENEENGDDKHYCPGCKKKPEIYKRNIQK